MKIYFLFEGQYKNDEEMNTAFYKKDRAIAAFEKSKYPYKLLNVYEGSHEDKMEIYLDTLREKGA